MVVKHPSHQCGWTNGSLLHSPGPLRQPNTGSLAPATSCVPSNGTWRRAPTACPGCPIRAPNPAHVPGPSNYIARLAGEKAKLGRVCRICSGIHAAFTLRTRAPICGPCKTTLATVIPSTRPTTHALPGTIRRPLGIGAASTSTSCGGLTEIGRAAATL